MKLILEHEAAHIRHLDALKKLCLTISCVCHWFNPLVWLMAALACRDMELACDEAVVRAVGRENRKLYADLLVELEAKRAGINLLTSGFGQSLMKERINHLIHMKEKILYGNHADYRCHHKLRRSLRRRSFWRFFHEIPEE